MSGNAQLEFGYIGKSPEMGNSEATCESRKARETNMPDNQRTKEAHYAGFFDSDGYIGIGMQNNKYGGISYACEVKFGVSKGRKKDILDDIHKHYQGHLEESEKRLQLSFRIDEAERFMKAVYPFIILKKPQAALWFKFREILKQRVSSRSTGYRHELRQGLLEKLNGMHASSDGPQGKPRPDWTAEETNAYAAGLMDGDGSLDRYVVRLTAKPKTIPEWLQNVFGGTLRHYPYKDRQCMYWEWYICGEERPVFLSMIKPYLFRQVDDRVRAAN